MKRAITGLAIAVSLLFTSSVLRPAPPASADICDSDAGLAVLALVTVGVGDIICTLNSQLAPLPPCGMTDVDVEATASMHSYYFGLNQDCDVQVKASYNVATREAAERLTGHDGTVEATWSCSDDPWIAPSHSSARCYSINAQVNPDTGAYDLSHATFPFSADMLTDKFVAVLTAQLQNALHQQPDPGPQVPVVATSLTTAATCRACGASTQASTSAVPVLPDFAVTRIGGNQQPTSGTVGMYDVVVANLGARPQGTVQVEIQVSGALQSYGLVMTPAGFSCSGTATIVCTGPLGGYGDPPITTSADFQLQVHAAAVGLGSVSATVDPSNAIQESNENNNAQTLAVTVK